MFIKFSQVSAFLTKPFNTDDFLEAIKNAIASKQ
jgi:FixJ family two-component response regulator